MKRSLLSVFVVFALVFVACGDDDADDASGAQPGDVTFDVEVIEIKGATDGIPAPDVDPESLSLGYRFKPPGEYDAENPDKWQVSTYLFAPGAMTVVNGDDVTLRLFGINGDEHVMWVEAPDGTKVTAEVVLNRGREIKMDFTADQLGHYKLICVTHAPTMQSDILSVSG